MSLLTPHTSAPAHTQQLNKKHLIGLSVFRGSFLRRFCRRLLCQHPPLIRGNSLTVRLELGCLHLLNCLLPALLANAGTGQELAVDCLVLTKRKLRDVIACPVLLCVRVYFCLTVSLGVL